MAAATKCLAPSLTISPPRRISTLDLIQSRGPLQSTSRHCVDAAINYPLRLPPIITGPTKSKLNSSYTTIPSNCWKPTLLPFNQLPDNPKRQTRSLVSPYSGSCINQPGLTLGRGVSTAGMGNSKKDSEIFLGSIDQGTTSTRFFIFDKQGQPVASHQLEFKQYHPQPG
jgi:hypothetical protein